MDPCGLFCTAPVLPPPGARPGCRVQALFEPLIKTILRKLDVGVEAYLERQQIINLLAIPSTILFLLLFWAFSGAGGAMLLLGLLLPTADVAASGGLFLWKEE